MNILMINGTMRKSSTYIIGKMFIERVSLPGDDVQELFLPKDLPEFCRGCGVCIMQGEQKCPDYLIYTKKILALMERADLLVFTTPTYVLHASGQMKAFLDHFAHQWMVHRPKKSMFRKQAVCISTAAGSGMKQAVADITDSLKYWGVARIFTYCVAVRSMDWEQVDKKVKDKVDRDLYRLMGKIKHDAAQVQASNGTKRRFYMMRMMHRKGMMSPADTRYWNEMGWVGKARPWREDRKRKEEGQQEEGQQEEAKTQQDRAAKPGEKAGLPVIPGEPEDMREETQQGLSLFEEKEEEEALQDIS